MRRVLKREDEQAVELLVLSRGQREVRGEGLRLGSVQPKRTPLLLASPRGPAIGRASHRRLETPARDQGWRVAMPCHEGPRTFCLLLV